MDKTLNFTHIPKEVQLILELLKEDNEPYIREHKVPLCENIDWNRFLIQTKHHRVYPLIHSKVKLLGDLVPSFVLKKLNKLYKKNTFQMLHLSAEMERVSKLFSEEQIRLLFLKGPMLAHDLYDDISLRTSSDLDLLIPINELEHAEEILNEQGYEKDDYIQTVLNDWKWRHHHVTYFHPQKAIKLEIHWKLNPGPAKEPMYNELWKQRRRSTLTGYPVFFLGKEDLLLFLITHGSRHGWSRLRWLIDIGQFMKQDLDWQKVYRLLKKHHYLHVGGQAIVLASELLNAKISFQMKSIVNRRSKLLAQQAIFYLETMVNLHSEHLPEKVERYHKQHLFSLMSIQQKILFTLSFLYPYPEDAETLPLPKQLHVLYFPLRPLLWAWRKTRKHALP